MNLTIFYTTSVGNYPAWKIIRNMYRITTECRRKYQKAIPNATKSAPNVTQNASKGHQKGTKLVPKRAKVSPNDAQEQTYRFLADFDCILGAISAPLSIKIPIKYFKKGLRKSMQEKYSNFMIKSKKNHAKMVPKFDHKSCEIRHSRFL